MKAVSGYIVLWYTLYHSPLWFTLLSDIAHFVVRNSPFHGAIWCFSAPEIGYFASRNGAFRNTKKCHLNISYWYSIPYKSLLYFAICARRRVWPQIRAYFSGYIGKLGGKNQNPVINWKLLILTWVRYKIKK